MSAIAGRVIITRGHGNGLKMDVREKGGLKLDPGKGAVKSLNVIVGLNS
jgi:hypothetical protein